VARYRVLLDHALAFLRNAHLYREQPDQIGYTWLLHWRDGVASVRDGSHHAYGLAFVLLAYAHALHAGVSEARTWLEETFALMEQRFWHPSPGLYADEANADGVLSPYRGQNANMHATEACLAAWEATGEERYLQRAALLAEHITQRQAALCSGMIWEHYREDWSVDWDYNRGDMSNIFRPWGYQPGHFAEWARLLLKLEVHRPLPWLLPRAQALFDMALQHGWDKKYEGLFYGFGPDLAVCDARKFHWVQCETLATAAVLARRTGQASYWQWYDRLWRYCWQHFVDHAHGSWHRVLARDNTLPADQALPVSRVDYHTTGVCWALLPALEA
jgi:mannose/cellobiose epimerase-like protein (N-acyl-D-glucosamine 2-epimerase family)